MRIVGGRWRGTQLAGLGKGDAAAHLRPTSDRVRENLFNLLAGGAHGDPVRGARVLDLFAGTGALGLEALSRGAAQATFVDQGGKSLKLLKANIERLDAPARVLKRDATRLGAAESPFDLVFLDPPYGQGLGERALISTLKGGWLAPEALVVWEDSAPAPAVPGLRQVDQRKYGGTHLSFLRPAT